MKAFFILIIVFLSGKALCQDTIPKVDKSTGVASFYASKFNGRKTCSGQRFSNDSLTAAHKKLKIGTYVMVRNLKNDSTVVVRINDRLPKSSKRCIDLTQRAAKQLNFMRAGLTRVEITVIDPLKE
jgi:rare lipoprotein A